MGFRPYFAVRIEKNPPTWDNKISEIEINDFKSYMNEDLKKIYTINSLDIGTASIDGVKNHFDINDQFESDVPYNTRFKLSNRLKSGVRIVY